MNKTTRFDVLVVYTDAIATSASTSNSHVTTPFPMTEKRAAYNDAYSYFLEMCKKEKLRAALTTSRDMLAEGGFSSYWTYDKGQWKKVFGVCSAPLIFDKFSATTTLQKERRLHLFADSGVRSFNSPHLHSLFFDKQKTYNQLKAYAIPTVTIKNRTALSIANATEKLVRLMASHPQRIDFTSDIVVKDRYGAGGNRIYKVGTENKEGVIRDILKKHRKKSFIMQPFAHFDQGYLHEKVGKSVDIRVVFMGQTVLFSYIRIAQGDDFKCNQHLGGTLEYLSPKQVPQKVSDMAQEIADSFSSSSSLFALDFVTTNSGNVYLMEGNCGPGISWDPASKQDEFHCKKLIRTIVRELSKRTVGARAKAEDAVFETLLSPAYSS